MKKSIRLRREYLYKKSLESRDTAAAKERSGIRNAVLNSSTTINNNIIPATQRHKARELLQRAEWDDNLTASKGPQTHVDDEYGIHVPARVCITTSRDPSSKLKEFVKELRLILGPTSVRMNRGQTTLEELVASCRSADFTDIVMCTEHRGDPDGLIISHLPYGPTARFMLSDCVTRHDIGKEAAGGASEAIPHLIFENFSSPIGKRFESILKHIFPAPARPDSKRIITFFNRDDVISFRHHTYEKTGNYQSVLDATTAIQLREIGPRFEMRPYVIQLGTLEQREEADVEWSLRSFINKRRKVLSSNTTTTTMDGGE
jgi:U3 small nucleolar ribonucleoprotein protein IMP4